MLKYENRCCGCASPSYPCRGAACPLRSVPVFYCDSCCSEIDGDPFVDDGDELCLDCLSERYLVDTSELDTLICDECGEDIEGEVYDYRGSFLCIDCLCELVG